MVFLKVGPRRLEGIEDVDAEIGDMRDIARRERHSMNLGGRCKERVDRGHRSPGAHAPPSIGNHVVDGQDAIRERFLHGGEPPLERP